jgi:hypothetical protein
MNSKTFLGTAISLLAAFVLIACSNPKKVEIPQDLQSWESDKDFKKAVDKLSEDDKKLFLSYIFRTQMSSAFGGKGLEKGTTIGNALDIQRAWQEELEKEEIRKKALREELLKKQVEVMKIMNAALTASLVDFDYHKADWESGTYSDFFSIKVGFRNNTGKDLAGVRGSVILKDIFGEIIKKINLSNDNSIKANSTFTYSGTIDFNQFKNEDIKLRSTSFANLKFEWEPDMYIFTDGSKMQMPL